MLAATLLGGQAADAVRFSADQALPRRDAAARSCRDRTGAASMGRYPADPTPRITTVCAHGSAADPVCTVPCAGPNSDHVGNQSAGRGTRRPRDHRLLRLDQEPGQWPAFSLQIWRHCARTRIRPTSGPSNRTVAIAEGCPVINDQALRGSPQARSLCLRDQPHWADPVKWHATYNSSCWSGDRKLGNDQSAADPVLPAYAGKLHCGPRGGNDDSLGRTRFDGTSWGSDYKSRSHQSSEGPALAVLGQAPYCVHRGMATYDQRLSWAKLREGASWYAFEIPKQGGSDRQAHPLTST